MGGTLESLTQWNMCVACSTTILIPDTAMETVER